MNESRSFWLWSTKEHSFDQFARALDRQPPIVLATFYDYHRFDPAHDLAGPAPALLQQRGYTLTHTFCGEMPQGLGWRDEICYLVFERHSGLLSATR